MGDIVKQPSKFRIPVEVINKAKLVDGLLLNKMLFTRDIEEAVLTFKTSSVYKGQFDGVHVYETNAGKELYGVTEVPATSKLTRYYQYKLQYVEEGNPIFNSVSDSVKTVLHTDNDNIIIFTNHNDMQTMVIVLKKRGAQNE